MARIELQRNDDEQSYERPKVSQITSVPGKRRKKSSLERLVKSFINDDSESVAEFIVYDILIPRIKDMLYEIVTGSSSRILYGGDRARPSKPGYSNTSRYHDSYRGKPSVPWRDDIPETTRKVARSARSYSSDDVEVESREKGLEILHDMSNYIELYGDMPVAVLNDFCGISSEPMDEKYGWTDISRAAVRYIRGKWVIVMPKAEYLD